MAEGYKLGKLSKENPERDLTIRAEHLIQKLDFEVLEDIFREERVKSGVKSEVSAVEIKYDSRSKVLGRWNQFDKSVTLNLKKLYEEYEEGRDSGWSKDDTSTFESYVTSCLTHELTHAHGHNSCEGTSKSTLLRKVFKSIFNNVPETFSQSGYSQFNRSERGTTNKYNAFNEAVTDLIAEEVFDEYKKRTADELVVGAGYARAYPLEKNRLLAFITVVCKRVETSPENIWKAVKQGYFSGLDLNDTELGHIYDDLVTAGLNEDWVSDNDSERLDEVIEFLYGDPAPKDFLERIRHALQELSGSERKRD